MPQNYVPLYQGVMRNLRLHPPATIITGSLYNSLPFTCHTTLTAFDIISVSSTGCNVAFNRAKIIMFQQQTKVQRHLISSQHLERHREINDLTTFSEVMKYYIIVPFSASLIKYAEYKFTIVFMHFRKEQLNRKVNKYLFKQLIRIDSEKLCRLTTAKFQQLHKDTSLIDGQCILDIQRSLYTPQRLLICSAEMHRHMEKDGLSFKILLTIARRIVRVKSSCTYRCIGMSRYFYASQALLIRSVLQNFSIPKKLPETYLLQQCSTSENISRTISLTSGY